MLKGFKDFILRGNVVDLAVAVVIGAAFATIVTAFTDSIIKPLINAITPGLEPRPRRHAHRGQGQHVRRFRRRHHGSDQLRDRRRGHLLRHRAAGQHDQGAAQARRGDRARRAHRGRAARRDPRSAERPAAAFGSAPVVMRGSVVEQRVVVGRSALVALVAGHVG